MSDTIVVSGEETEETGADVRAEIALETAIETEATSDLAVENSNMAVDIAADARAASEEIRGRVEEFAQLVAGHYDNIVGAITALGPMLDAIAQQLSTIETAIEDMGNREIPPPVVIHPDKDPDEHKGHWLTKRIGSDR